MLMKKLNNGQVDKLADISSEIGLVAFASVVLPAILDRWNTIEVVIGTLFAFLFWAISLWLLKANM